MCRRCKALTMCQGPTVMQLKEHSKHLRYCLETQHTPRRKQIFTGEEVNRCSTRGSGHKGSTAPNVVARLPARRGRASSLHSVRLLLGYHQTRRSSKGPLLLKDGAGGGSPVRIDNVFLYLIPLLIRRNKNASPSSSLPSSTPLPATSCLGRPHRRSPRCSGTRRGGSATRRLGRGRASGCASMDCAVSRVPFYVGRSTVDPSSNALLQSTLSKYALSGTDSPYLEARSSYGRPPCRAAAVSRSTDGTTPSKA